VSKNQNKKQKKRFTICVYAVETALANKKDFITTITTTTTALRTTTLNETTKHNNNNRD